MAVINKYFQVHVQDPDTQGYFSSANGYWPQWADDPTTGQPDADYVDTQPDDITGETAVFPIEGLPDDLTAASQISQCVLRMYAVPQNYDNDAITWTATVELGTNDAAISYTSSEAGGLKSSTVTTGITTLPANVTWTASGYSKSKGGDGIRLRIYALELEITYTPNSTWQQGSYRWRNDNGSESAATWLEAANTEHDFTEGSGNVDARLRFVVDETHASGSVGTEGSQQTLMYGLNGLPGHEDFFAYASNSGTVSALGANEKHNHFFVHPSGTAIFTCSLVVATSAEVQKYNLSTAWDLSTISSTPDQTYDCFTNTPQPWVIYFNADGTKMWLGDNTNETIDYYTLSVGWDLTSTVTLAGTWSISQYMTTSQYPRSFWISTDGTKVVIQTSTGIYQFELGSAYLWTTHKVVYSHFDEHVENMTSSGGFYITPDGGHLFIPEYTTTTSTECRYYALLAEGDVSTVHDKLGVTPDHTYTTTSQISYSSPAGSCGWYCNNDGTVMIGMKSNGNNGTAVFYKYTCCDSAGDVTTTSSVVKAIDSSNLTDGDDTTQQVGAGTFITNNNGVCEDGTTTAAGASSGNDEYEVEFALQFIDADIADGDEVYLRLKSNAFKGW